jgi:hypothetical protein
MDIQNEVHFLKDIERTPSFIVHQKKDDGYYWAVDVTPEQALTEKDGFPQFEDLNESE